AAEDIVLDEGIRLLAQQLLVIRQLAGAGGGGAVGAAITSKAAAIASTCRAARRRQHGGEETGPKPAPSRPTPSQAAVHRLCSQRGNVMEITVAPSGFARKAGHPPGGTGPDPAAGYRQRAAASNDLAH